MSRQIALALAVLAVLIGATVAADRVVAAPTPPEATFTEEIAVDSGTWYCVPIAREGQTATLTVSAVDEGGRPARVSVTTVADGQADRDGGVRELAPGESFDIEVPGASRPPAVVVRWRDAPVTTSWQVRTAGGDRLGATCASSPSPRWLLSGASTVIGSSARVYLFNPFDTDAVARVAFATPEGRVNLVSSENLSVPARRVVSVDVTGLQPEQPDLGVIVEVDAGRVIATGSQQFGQPDLPEIELEGAELTGDPSAPEGRTVLHAVPTDAPTSNFAYAESGENTTSWVTVLNPNTRPAQLEVRTTDPVTDGTAAEQVEVGPESVARIELDGLSSSPNYGVTIASTDDTGVVATRYVAVTGDDPTVTASPGTPDGDTTNVAATVPADTAPELALYNAGDTLAAVAVNLGGSTPEPWQDLELPPGEMRLLPFADADADVGDSGAPLVVSANQPVHGTLRLATSDDRSAALLAQPLVPASQWQGAVDALVPRQDRTLETRPVDFPAQQDR